ncbi:MAG: hypothetical protein ACPGYY_04775 [Bacteroidia bacterium]
MKLSHFLLIVFIACLSSCKVTETTNLYHTFTNEYDVVGVQQSDVIEVYHQMDEEYLALKMLNKTDSNYFFDWSQSTLSINNKVLPIGGSRDTALLAPGEFYEAFIPLIYKLENAKVDLADTSTTITLTTHLNFLDKDGSHFANTYTMYRLGSSEVLSGAVASQEGVNYLKTSKSRERISGKETIKTAGTGIVLIAIIIASATLEDE